jgi:hypothetical protein
MIEGNFALTLEPRKLLSRTGQAAEHINTATLHHKKLRKPHAQAF